MGADQDQRQPTSVCGRNSPPIPKTRGRQIDLKLVKQIEESIKAIPSISQQTHAKHLHTSPQSISRYINAHVHFTRRTHIRIPSIL